MRKEWILGAVVLVGACASARPPAASEMQPIPDAAAIDARVAQVMARTGAKGLALAVIDDGQVAYVRAYGARNAKGDPLGTGTVLYGASLTKTVVAYTVMRLVDQGRIALDTPLADDLDKPLPDYDPAAIFPDKYGPYRDLADDPRWKAITPRMVLTHSTGFANFAWLEPDHKLRIHFDPGTRFAYSGEGFILLQFAIDNGRRAQGLGTDLGALVQANAFDPLGMRRSSLAWRDDFAGDLADAWNDQGEAQPHDQRSKTRAAGSMDTTIADMARFAAALIDCAGLSPASCAEMTRPQLAITTRSQFPTLQAELPAEQRRADLAAGLGVVVFDGPQGHGFFKGGHDEQTGNTMVCLRARRRCLLLMANDVRAEAGFDELVRFVLGDTGVPFDWEYGDHAGKS